jgi:hypothetical protein
LRGRLREGEHGFAREHWRAFGNRTRLQTPRRLEPVFGAAPKPDRIDTLKCRNAISRSTMRCVGWRPSKHMRGGRKPNGQAHRPRRGKRS